LKIFQNRVLGGYLRTGYWENIWEQGTYRIFENRVLAGRYGWLGPYHALGG
jgi:hypothetical protein